MNDLTRQAAFTAVRDFLDQNQTNAIAQNYVWRVVNDALNAYDDEFVRSARTLMGFVVMLGSQPMLVVPNKRIAKTQMKLMRRTVGAGAWRITRTQFTLMEED